MHVCTASSCHLLLAACACMPMHACSLLPLGVPCRPTCAHDAETPTATCIVLAWLAHAGWHEVVVTEATLAAIEAARSAGRPLWRVSSTVFSHVASHQILQPLGRFAQEPGAADAYPPTPAGKQVQQELETIKLKGAPL